MRSTRKDIVAEGLTFDLPGGGQALFTTRAHGNMSSVGGLEAEHGALTRERLRTQLALSRLVRGYQVHGAAVRRIRAPDDLPAPDTISMNEGLIAISPPIEADGHATCLAGVGVMALGADCLPVALGGERAVAMVHAGWRGLAAGVLEQGVLALRELGATGDLAAIVGPGAGACCYEVGENVHSALGDAHRHGRHIDLKALARDRLRAAGVTDVRDAGICTICDERFFSHRREGALAGRQAGIAWLE